MKGEEKTRGHRTVLIVGWRMQTGPLCTCQVAIEGFRGTWDESVVKGMIMRDKHHS